MKPLAQLALLAASLSACLSAGAADVGISVQVSEPGLYGRIDIGRFPQPQVIVAQPVMVAPPYVRPLQPVYMWVPPGHRKDWRKHCGAYGACGVPVYFVDDDWYGRNVQPYAGHKGNKGHGNGNGNGKGGGKGKGHD
jgi:hypothetical protein